MFSLERKKPDFFRTFISSPLLIPSGTRQTLNTFFWDTLYVGKKFKSELSVLSVKTRNSISLSYRLFLQRRRVNIRVEQEYG